MKKITSIQFVNYKAFYGNGEQNIITIKDGKSVLIYGENGSGKSSIYEGIKQFFNSSDNTKEVIPARHLNVPAIETVYDDEIEGQVEVKVIINEVAVKVTFEDAGILEEKIFGVPTENVKGTRYISNANLLNSFLSYRELLRTYLMDNLKDKIEFRRKFAALLIETILAKNINGGTQTSYASFWEHLHRPFGKNKNEDFDKFKIGLVKDIKNINLVLNEIISFFESELKVQLILTTSYIDYYYSLKTDRIGNYPICEIDLKIELFGENVENDEENHLTVLNEARLSAIAISIYFASIINAPQVGFDYKILFLDDIFIGLDMSNRIPLLRILTEFKKPKVILSYSELTSKFDESIQLIDGVKQYEENPFFDSFQVFITTYDRYWFGVAKDYFENRVVNKWSYIEIFANKRDGLDFNTPLVYNSLDYLEKANYYFKKHDYPTCANHLRKAIEKRIKELLPKNRFYIKTINSETGFEELKKINSLSGFIDRFILYHDEIGIDASELVELKNLKDWYFNPFSHDNIGTPIYKREVETAKALVDKLYKFEINILVEAGTNLYFQFLNEEGNTREYKIELLENIRSVFTNNQHIITDANVKCYEWTKDGHIEMPVWPNSKLFHFYRNKKIGFFKDPNLEVDNLEIQEEVKTIDNDTTLKTMLENYLLLK